MLNESDSNAEVTRAVAVACGYAKPIYPVRFSEVRHLNKHLDGGVCRGWYGPHLDLVFRDWLKAVGRWEGRGAAFVVRDELGGDVLSVHLHELAHVLEETSRLATMTEADIATEWSIEFNADTITETSGTLPLPKLWTDHGTAFIRAACHIGARARALGLVFRTVDLGFAGPHYGLSWGWRYDMALGDETAEHSETPLRTVLDSDYPQAFRRLWWEDTGLHI